MQVNLYDFSPVLELLMVGAAVAAIPLAWIGVRNRNSTPKGWLRSLTLVTLFLTFDLVLFGAFTRLTDSGLGCPDWPGCYGNASPLGAHAEISAAQAAMPSGPVTHHKAWIEMVHRYWASGVGALILIIMLMSWHQARNRFARDEQRLNLSPWWAVVTLVWVCIQGAFGALTVTMKLFPAIVSLHLLGGYVLLALLTVQAIALSQGAKNQLTVEATLGQRIAIALGLGLLLVQAASGAWVSTNYAVLACTDFPQCHGKWWPEMNFDQAFTLWRPLGHDSDGQFLPFSALTAIHFTHRMLALVTVVALGALSILLWPVSALRFWVRCLVVLLLIQVATGVSNVVLDWPLLAAVLHTGGAGALVVVLVALLSRTSTTSYRRRSP